MHYELSSITTAWTADRENDAIFSFCKVNIKRIFYVGSGRFPVRSRGALCISIKENVMVRFFLYVSLFFLLSSCAATTPSPEALNKMSVQELNQLAVDLWENDKDKYTDPELAIRYADLAISKDSSYARAYYTKGFAYYNLKKYQLSIENFSKSIELNPNIAEVYNGRGWVYGTIDDYEKAIEDFTKAIEINPNYLKAYNNRGYTYIHTNENEKACLDFQKACDLGYCHNIKHAKKIGKCSK
jgi:tetratricopeptide (TPR) repeat protein